MGCAGSQPEQLTPERIAQALVEALKVAAQVAVQTVSAPGGFENNAAIHIPIPGVLGEMCDKLKALPGFDDKIAEFEKSINQAAEEAAGGALDILMNAINGMTFDDAKAILDGPANAATEYFIKLTRGDLFAKFTPIIEEKMDKFGVVTVYDALTGAYGKLPFCDAPTMNLSEYVTNKGLDGLFAMFADEEKKIRGNPAGQTSEVVQDVFGQAGKQ